jgi:hypothetical protein
MTRPRLLASLLLLLATLWVTAAGAEPTWAEVEATTTWSEHAVKEHDAIGQVTILHTVVGTIDCFCAVATTAAGSEVGVEVAKDIEGIVRFSDSGITEGRILARDGEGLDYFQYFDTPGWTGAKDRFWFLRGKVTRTADTVVWWWERLVQGGPHKAVWDEVVAEHPKAIEPTANVGAWHFTTVPQGSVARYFVCSDSGGSIPRKLQFLATTKTLPDTMADVLLEAIRRQEARR